MSLEQPPIGVPKMPLDQIKAELLKILKTGSGALGRTLFEEKVLEFLKKEKTEKLSRGDNSAVIHGIKFRQRLIESLFGQKLSENEISLLEKNLANELGIEKEKQSSYIFSTINQIINKNNRSNSGKEMPIEPSRFKNSYDGIIPPKSDLKNKRRPVQDVDGRDAWGIGRGLPENDR